MSQPRTEPLLTWQRAHYDDNHTLRRALILHALSVPIFWFGTLAILAAPLVAWPLALVGLLSCALAMAAQGRAHASEPVAPIPFASPLDALARIVAEQWITFPRFVLDGGFAAAWRRANEA